MKKASYGNTLLIVAALTAMLSCTLFTEDTEMTAAQDSLADEYYSEEMEMPAAEDEMFDPMQEEAVPEDMQAPKDEEMPIEEEVPIQEEAVPVEEQETPAAEIPPLGQTSTTPQNILEQARQRELVRQEEARISATTAMQNGDDAMRRGNVEDAITFYREALLILRYYPQIESQEISAAIVKDKLQQALRDQQAGITEQNTQAAVEAKQEQSAKEYEDLLYKKRRVQALMRKADQAYVAGKYATSEKYLKQLLAIDPLNEDAKQLLEVAKNSRHQETERKNLQSFREEWQKTFEQLRAEDVPQTETIAWDLEHWREVSKRKPTEFTGPEIQLPAAERAILETLNNTYFAPKFDGAPIEEVAKFLQDLTGVNFLLSTAVQDMDPEQKSIRLDLPETSVKKLLDILTEITPLGYRVKHGVVQIVTQEEMKGGQYLAFYEVRDITRPAPNFPAPEINLVGSAGPIESEEELPEREAKILTEDELVELIRNNVQPASWSDSNNSISPQRGTLIVSQRREVHEQIQGLLNDLREAAGIMVDIQARFLTVEDNFLADIGVDIRGLGDDAAAGVAGSGNDNPFDDFGDTLPNQIGNDFDSGAFYDFAGDSDVRARAENLYDLTLGGSSDLTNSGGLSVQYTFLDNVQLEAILRAVQKSERVQTLQAPSLLVFNTERASIQVLDKISYIRDFDTQLTQSSAIADPQVDWVHTGVVLDVTPVVSSDRRFITMELRPTVANLKRPIQTVPTSLSTGTPVNIQLPELEIQRVRTTVTIPDGATLLLAGSTVVEKQELESGVPILSKIPLIGFFFSRKGDFSQRKKLLILVRAKIVIPEEKEPLVTNLR